MSAAPALSWRLAKDHWIFGEPQAQRGKGIGAELVRRVLDHARAQPQLVLVQLTVTQGNHGAQGLYERQGFTPFGVEPCAVAVGERYVSKVHMWCDLRSALG